MRDGAPEPDEGEGEGDIDSGLLLLPGLPLITPNLRTLSLCPKLKHSDESISNADNNT